MKILGGKLTEVSGDNAWKEMKYKRQTSIDERRKKWIVAVPSFEARNKNGAKKQKKKERDRK